MPVFPKKRSIDHASFGSADLKAKYGLPKEVTFCQRCVTSNQKPISAIEFQQVFRWQRELANRMSQHFAFP